MVFLNRKFKSKVARKEMKKKSGHHKYRQEMGSWQKKSLWYEIPLELTLGMTKFKCQSEHNSILFYYSWVGSISRILIFCIRVKLKKLDSKWNLSLIDKSKLLFWSQRMTDDSSLHKNHTFDTARQMFWIINSFFLSSSSLLASSKDNSRTNNTYILFKFLSNIIYLSSFLSDLMIRHDEWRWFLN